MEHTSNVRGAAYPVSRFKQNRNDSYFQRGPDGWDVWAAAAVDRLPIGKVLTLAAGLITRVALPALRRLYTDHRFDNPDVVGHAHQSGMWLTIRHLEEIGERLAGMGEDLEMSERKR